MQSTLCSFPPLLTAPYWTKTVLIESIQTTSQYVSSGKHDVPNSPYSPCSPQSDCILLFTDPSVTVWPSRSRFYVRDVINTGVEVSPQAEAWKTPTLEPLRSKHSWLSEKKKEGAFKNTKIKCHFKFHFVTVGKLLSESDRMKVHSKRGRGGEGCGAA